MEYPVKYGRPQIVLDGSCDDRNRCKFIFPTWIKPAAAALIFRGRADRWSIESDAVVGFAKRNPSIVIEARSSSLSLAESNESHGAAAAAAAAQRSGLKVGMFERSR